MDDINEPHAGGGSATETDVQVVMARAMRVWALTVVNDWLWGANSYLDGAPECVRGFESIGCYAAV